MSDRPSIVLAAHGTADPAGRAVIEHLRVEVADRIGAPVLLGWVDLVRPQVADVLVDEAVLVPVFLGSGRHVRVDLPAAVRRMRGARLTDAFGPEPEVIEALVDRLATAGVPAGASAGRAVPREVDAVLLVGAGSSDPRSRAETATAARKLAVQLNIEVRVAFLSAAPPTVADAVVELQRDGFQLVAVSSYLLAPGWFQRRLATEAATAGACAVTATIGAHPAIINLVCRRIEQQGVVGVTRPVDPGGVEWTWAGGLPKSDQNRG